MCILQDEFRRSSYWGWVVLAFIFLGTLMSCSSCSFKPSYTSHNNSYGPVEVDYSDELHIYFFSPYTSTLVSWGKDVTYLTWDGRQATANPNTIYVMAPDHRSVILEMPYSSRNLLTAYIHAECLAKEANMHWITDKFLVRPEYSQLFSDEKYVSWKITLTNGAPKIVRAEIVGSDHGRFSFTTNEDGSIDGKLEVDDSIRGAGDWYIHLFTTDTNAVPLCLGAHKWR